MDTFIAIFLFIFSSLYTILLDYIAASPRSLQQALILPTIVLVIEIYSLLRTSREKSYNFYEKWLVIFWGVFFIQLLIISTGGLESPFFILVHLFMIALSLFSSFFISFLFFITTCFVIVLDLIIHQNLPVFFLKNFNTIILQCISLISIIPFTYLVANKYHMKDFLFALLRSKVATDEAIMEKLPELIIITDSRFHILSVNDAVEKTLLKSRSEMLHMPVFDVLKLQDSSGKIVTKETFLSNGEVQPKQTQNTYTLLLSSLSKRTVTVQIQVTKNAEFNTNQISFIMGYAQQFDSLYVVLEKARAKYEAISENVKKQLTESGLSFLKTQIMLQEKIEHDIYTAQLVKDDLRKNTLSRIDLAKLCKHTVLSEKSFATMLNVYIDFQIKNFGMKDITHLTLQKVTVTPEEFTGPFFTAACDVKHVEFVMKKLLDIHIFLASNQKQPGVTVSIEKQKNTIVIQVASSCPVVSQEELADLFVPEYGKLYNKTQLHLGSGLEGFLVKRITDLLGIPLTYEYDRAFSRMISRIFITGNFFTAPREQ